MADDPDESAGQSQIRGCSSYSLSLPSQPPDIRNWFSSYEYESPEDSELVADPGGGDGNGSETQDPLEVRVPGHSLSRQVHQNGCNSLIEKCYGNQSEHGGFAIRHSVSIGKSTVQPGAKRKQSLRGLFGAGFLEDLDEATETENLVVSGVQRNAAEPPSNRDIISLPDTKRSHGNAVKHWMLLGDHDGISSAETQEENLPGGQKAEQSRLSVNCGGTGLSVAEEGILEHGIEHSKHPANCHSKISPDAQKSSPDDDTEHHILPANSVGIDPADIEGTSHGDEISRHTPTMEYKKAEETAAADGFVAVKKKAEPAKECRLNKIRKSTMERKKADLQENRSILEHEVLIQDRTRRPLADMTNHPEIAGAPQQDPGGKWKCPRRGKPYVGPSLKQLRLEQWVRRG